VWWKVQGCQNCKNDGTECNRLAASPRDVQPDRRQHLKFRATVANQISEWSRQNLMHINSKEGKKQGDAAWLDIADSAATDHNNIRADCFERVSSFTLWHYRLDEFGLRLSRWHRMREGQ
jgi:hypothetical protein